MWLTNGDQKVRLSCTTRIYRSYAKVVIKTKLNQGTTDESFAIDNVVFDSTKPNIFHTRNDRVRNKIGSWAEFTLPFPVRVSKVIVYNRQDCCQYNLYGALLELVDSKNNIRRQRCGLFHKPSYRLRTLKVLV